VVVSVDETRVHIHPRCPNDVIGDNVEVMPDPGDDPVLTVNVHTTKGLASLIHGD
jgi:hypothetical protein